ncbi:hypothetical protein KC340_g12193 [Hortaea werneckii]|nr:hypothetical protein KC342_g3554 [Hortaea werneckii]KAI7107816.1 hypothetical protein KC339_g2085 [Hortaea werneckii]KAI7242486.1 hypothetical protein KC365_g3141 [Hortaea werneckii]KAI7304567.1 hypothetical protein KC340_g12193 [Hortaea werneckii]KAI7389171.1 hypothetical protein KC328_g8583 [Hortaea werneckii]
MKTATLFAALAATAVASPLSKRGVTENEVENGECRTYTFIFARGSTEIGNMGETVGPATCNALKKKYGDNEVACQGVGGAYTAGLAQNALPDGTTQGALNEAKKMFNDAHSKCPNTIITAGGYSQGAAVMTGSVGELDDDVKSTVAGVVLYGDTRNKQENGGSKEPLPPEMIASPTLTSPLFPVPGYPKDKVKVYCAATDGVCGGALLVTAGHLTYMDDVSDAADWLEGKISSAGSSTSSSSGSSSSGAASSSSSGSSGSGLSSLFGGGF